MTKVKRNKHGATTIFLSIVLSALVLVECTFLTFVWDLDRRLEINRALKAQVEAVLSSYNRELYEVYGIYGFTMDDVDGSIFDRCLRANGLESGQDIYIRNVRTINTDCIKKAIASYYAYRAGGIIATNLSQQIGGLLSSLDKTGVISKIREFTSSEAAQHLKNAFERESTITDWINQAADTLDVAGFTDQINEFRNLYQYVDDGKNDFQDLGIDFDVGNMRFALDAFNGIYNLEQGISDFASSGSIHFCMAHYAAYNFDCAVSNDKDTTINGTKFSDIHSENYFDAEYIFSGFDGRLGFVRVITFAFEIIFVKEFLSIMADATQQAAIKGIAAVLTVVVAAITGATVDIPPEVWEIIITMVKAAVSAIGETKSLLDGNRVNMFEDQGVGFVSLGYREFLFMFMCLNSEYYMLRRMVEILTRDYGEIYREINLGTTYRGTEYYVEREYDLYD